MAVITTEKLAPPSAPWSTASTASSCSTTTPSRPGRLEALEANGALVFRGLHLDDETQVAFSRKLGTGREASARASTRRSSGSPSTRRRTRRPQYLRGTFDWHIDGCTDDIPIMATMLSAHAVADSGGETEFASTYEAYEHLDDDEKARLDGVRVVHTIEASQRLFNHDPSPEELAHVALAPGQGAPARVDAPLRPPLAGARRHHRPRRGHGPRRGPGAARRPPRPAPPRPTASTATSGRSVTS